jgi:hypothetical protein
MTAPVVDAQPLIDAIKAEVTAAGVAIAEGKKPTVSAGRPYIVAFYDSGAVDDRSLRSRDGWAMVGSFQCAGLSPESARFAARKLRGALLALHGATFGDRALQMPAHLGPLPMQRDDDAEPVLFIQIEEWRLRLS